MKFLERENKKNKKNSEENGPLAETEQDRKSSRIIDKRTREETGMGNQMTALRFQTGERYQTTPVYRRGDTCQYLGSNPPPPSQCCELDHNTRRQKKKKKGSRNKPKQLSLLVVQYHSVCSVPLRSATPPHAPVVHLKRHSALTPLNGQKTANASQLPWIKYSRW